MQRESRKEEQSAEPREDVKDRKPRFRIVKLEERIAPGGGHGNGSNHIYGCNYTNPRGCRGGS
jgi:hypothetical protein